MNIMLGVKYTTSILTQIDLYINKLEIPEAIKKKYLTKLTLLAFDQYDFPRKVHLALSEQNSRNQAEMFTLIDNQICDYQEYQSIIPLIEKAIKNNIIFSESLSIFFEGAIRQLLLVKISYEDYVDYHYIEKSLKKLKDLYSLSDLDSSFSNYNIKQMFENADSTLLSIRDSIEIHILERKRLRTKELRRQRGKRMGKALKILIILAVLGVVIFAGYNVISNFINNQQNTEITYPLGSIENPYIITTPDELQNMRSSASYVLGNDIDLNGYSWTPLCNEKYPFNGHLDGNGYTIYNLKVSNYESNGLFAYVGSGATLTNLIFEKAEITGAPGISKYVAVIAGCSKGEISNCKVFNSYVSGGGSLFGGLVGLNDVGTIRSCSFNGNVINEAVFIKNDNFNSATGGILGSNTYGEISNCKASGTITGLGYVGGIVGVVTSAKSIISECSFSGIVNAEFSPYPYPVMTRIAYTAPAGGAKSDAGGIAGCISGGGVVTDCTSSGTISSNKNKFSIMTGNAGGILGSISYSSSGTVRKCTSSTQVYKSSYSNADGICPDTDATLSGNTFTGAIVQ